MARAMLGAILTAAAASSLTGCGTFFNCFAADKAGPQAEQKVGRIYGGVLFEVQAAQSLVNDMPREAIPKDWVLTVCGSCLLAIDMPLTAVGDTLTLPYTLRYTLACRRLSRQPEQDQLGADRAKPAEESPQ